MTTVFEQGCFTLNPLIFDAGKMKSEVRERLLEIVDEFLSQLDPSFTFDIIDIVLVGSNASYNYTEHSDLDVHLIVNLAQICEEHPEIVQYLFNSEKSRFNLNYDISVKGIQVEIYAEDVRAGTVSNGIYSILSDLWIKYPEPTHCSREQREIAGVDDICSEIGQALQSGSSQEIKRMINNIYLMRKQSLETDGEYGQGNLAFKEIRNRGLLDELKNQYYETRSSELSLEGVKVEEDIDH